MPSARSKQYSYMHDDLTRRIERETGTSISDWFERLDRAGRRRHSLIATVDWLSSEHDMPFELANALTWNYFYPDMLPADLRAGITDLEPAQDLEEEELDMVESAAL